MGEGLRRDPARGRFISTQKGSRPMYRWQMNRSYREPERWTPWTAGLAGGALGIMLVGVLWYVQSRPRIWSQSPKRSEEHTSELQSRLHLVCRLLLEKKNK